MRGDGASDPRACDCLGDDDDDATATTTRTTTTTAMGTTTRTTRTTTDDAPTTSAASPKGAHAVPTSNSLAPSALWGVSWEWLAGPFHLQGHRPPRPRVAWHPKLALGCFLNQLAPRRGGLDLRPA